MGKIAIILISITLLFCFFLPQPSFAATSNNILLYLNGKQLNPEVFPRKIGDTSMVPIRIISEALGAKVGWNQSDYQVTIDKGDVHLQLVIDNKNAIVNGINVSLDMPPKLISGNTLVPVRFVAEQLGIQVNWDDETQSVYLIDNSLTPVQTLKTIDYQYPSSKDATGNLLFIWKANSIDNGDVTAMVNQAKQLGVTGVIIKFANGNLDDDISRGYMDQFKKLVGPFKSAGFKVGGWMYQYLTDVQGEVDACSQAIQAGADFIVLDGEGNLKGKDKQVAEFGRLFREKYPKVLVGLSSYAIADLHQEVPFDSYNQFVDVMMPQIYWADMGWNVDKAFTSSILSYKRFGKPISPTGQLCSTAQTQDILRFVKLSQESNFSIISWWNWGEANQNQLKAIQGIPIQAST